MSYLIDKCPVLGDARWIYDIIKHESNAPTIMSHSKLVGNFFNNSRSDTNLNAAKLLLD